MTTESPAFRRRTGRLIGSCAILLMLAIVLGICVNLFRPVASRLPWIGDWDEHIETRAFNAGIPVVFLLAAREWVQTGEGVLLDARPLEQYRAGHLPGALPMPLDAVDERLAEYAALLDMDTPVWMYCSGEDCADSLDLALKLRTYGFTDLTLYPGGYAEWKEYGGTIHQGDEP